MSAEALRELRSVLLAAATAVIAWLVLGGVAAGLHVLPFAWLVPLLGRPGAPDASFGHAEPERARRARAVRRAIARAVRSAPFRADCLPQAFAAAILCRCCRVPAATFLGVCPDGVAKGGRLTAHAWVAFADVIVTGGANAHEFRPIACFVPGSGTHDKR